MKAAIFLGPTLTVDDARRRLDDRVDAAFLPPVEQGDLYQVARWEKPHLIAVVDGFFENRPSVWHKEILWAMARGIHVLGSSSMGALRAAELDRLGMEGIGEIYRAFADGRLEADDEVAVVHGPPESGFLSLSEALVNIRFTLDAARSAGVVSDAAAETLVELARSTYYPERSWPRLLEAARSAELEGTELDALESWLPEGKIDQKREDALALLDRVRELAEGDPQPKTVRYRFQHTDSWERARRRADQRPAIRSIEESGAASSSGLLPAGALLDELKLLGEPYRRQRESALVRALALEVADRRSLELDAAALDASVEELRREHGLLEPEEFERWLEAQSLTDARRRRFLREEAKVRHVRSMAEPDLERDLPHQLKSAGLFGRLRDRARRKYERLQALGMPQPRLEDVELSESELWTWYFEHRLGRAVPEDLQAYAFDHGFDGVEGLRWAVLREYPFVEAEDP